MAKGEVVAGDTGPPGTGGTKEVTAGGFDEFYAANFHRLTLELYAYTGDVGQAQDAVQEAFTRAWPRWGRLVAYDQPVSWVRRVAWNVAINGWRRFRVARAHAHYHRERVIDGPGPERVALARPPRRPHPHRPRAPRRTLPRASPPGRQTAGSAAANSATRPSTCRAGRDRSARAGG